MSTFRLEADFANGVKIEGGFISFVQQDTNSCKLDMQLKDKGVAVDMTNKRATLTVVTPGGATIEETHLEIVEATNGLVSLTMPSDMILEEGKHKAQIQLYPSDTYVRESTVIFNYMISNSLMTDQKLLATDRFSTLEGLILTVEALEKEVSDNKQTIEEVTAQAEKAKDDAVLSASYSIQSANSAKEAAQAAQATTGVLDEVVEQARQSAIASTESAEASKASADEADRAAKTAIAATDKANTSVSTANQAVINVNTAITEVTANREVAQDAANQAREAANVANNAATTAEQAVTKVNQAVTQAQGAVSTANTAVQEANQANNTAQESISRAETAINTSTTLITKAEAANQVAEATVLEANKANIAANKAVVDATAEVNKAKEEATKATTQANKAEVEAVKATEQAGGAKTSAERAKIEADRAADAAAQHVTVNGATKENIDFICNEVVQDGLIFCEKATLKKYEAIGAKVIILKQKLKSSNIWLADFSGTNGLTLGFYKDKIAIRNSSGSVYYTVSTQSITDIYVKLESCQDGFTLTNMYNGDSVLISLGNETTFSYVEFRNTAYWCEFHEIQVQIYNRILTPQEIAHNFQVLNNSPSVSGITVTDEQSNKSSLLFATDSEHVTMRNGYNAEECVTSVMNKFKREFVADASGIIEITNGFERGKVLGAEIKGQTAKQIIPTFHDYKSDQYLFNEHFRTEPLKPNQLYTIVADISSMTGTTSSSLLKTQLGKSNGTFSQVAVMSNLKVGMNFVTITTNEETVKINSNYVDSSSENVYRKVMVFEGDLTNKINSYIPFGLNSTVASINANGQSYPIYEPTIQGKTEILRTIKGTQNWEVIDASSERDTSRYDYKLSSLEPSVEGLPSLGSTPSTSDTIDRASGVFMCNSDKYVIPTVGWSGKNVDDEKSIGYFRADKMITSTNDVICATLPVKTWSEIQNLAEKPQCVWVSGATSWGVVINKGNASTFEQYTSYVSNLNIRIKLATPTTQQLTPTQLRAYDAFKKIILLPFAEDKVTLNEDGSGTWVDASMGEQYNGSENWTMHGITTNNTSRFTLTIKGNPHANGLGYIWCDNYKEITHSNGVLNRNEGTGISLHNDGVSVDIITQVQTLEEFKQSLRTNPINVRYRVATPIATTIPKSLIPTISIADKNIILEGGGAVKPSSLKATIPVDRISELNARLEALENVTIKEALQ